jgi:hypothetical protein
MKAEPKRRKETKKYNMRRKTSKEKRRKMRNKKKDRTQRMKIISIFLFRFVLLHVYCVCVSDD